MFNVGELFSPYNKDSCFELITGDVNIYLYGCANQLAPLFLCACVWECLCVSVQLRVLVRSHMCQNSVNLMPCVDAKAICIDP